MSCSNTTGIDKNHPRRKRMMDFRQSTECPKSFLFFSNLIFLFSEDTQGGKGAGGTRVHGTYVGLCSAQDARTGAERRSRQPTVGRDYKTRSTLFEHAK